MSKTYRAIAIDDEQDAIDLLMDNLAGYPFIRMVETYTDPKAGVEGVIKYNPDVLFLDIQMPVMDGFGVVSRIHEQNLHPIIIFITGYDKFALKAIKYAAFDYLIKPVDPDELKETIDKLNRTKENDISSQLDRLLNQLNSHTKLKFNTRTGFVLIDSEEVVYCLADRNYSEIYLLDGRKEVVTCNLRKLFSQLDPSNFFRAGRSLIINTNFLVKVNRTKNQLVLKYLNDFKEFSIPAKQLKQLKEL